MRKETIEYINEITHKHLDKILGHKNYSLLIRDEKYEDKRTDRYKFSLRSKDNKAISFFSLEMIPGNCGICVSTGSFVFEQYRNRGIGKALNLVRIEIAKRLGYSIIMCTIKESNTIQKKILWANNWRQDYTFLNMNTGNTIGVYYLRL